MRVGLTLAGNLLNADGAKFAAELGATDIVVHLTNYARNADQTPYLAGAVGPVGGDARGDRLWTYEDFCGVKSMLAAQGLRLAALENFSPIFWHDILLDGPKRDAQMEDLKRLVRDAGRAGVPVIGYNFSIAGVWGWTRRPEARAGAMTDRLRHGGDRPERADPGRHGLEHALPRRTHRSTSRARLRSGALGSARPFPEGAGAGRRGGRRDARRASRRSAGGCAPRRGAARQPP